MSAFPYRTPAVRDLAWACFSPQLLQVGRIPDAGRDVVDCGLSLTPVRVRWLERLDSCPAPLLDHLGHRPSHRLGVYFEQLWQFFLAHDPAVELIAHNLPVRDRERTLGEFDLIYLCHERQRYFHLELAVKFFLGHRLTTRTEAASHWREWLGPNTSDRLDLKLEQLLRHQVRLGDRAAAREQLAAMGIAGMDREIALRGYLFQSPTDPLPPPVGFNPGHRLDQWLPLGGLDTHLQSLEARAFLLLSRLQWLAPAHAQDHPEIFSRYTLAKRLQSLLAASARAQLVAGVDASGIEICRFFVTHDRWPLAPC